LPAVAHLAETELLRATENMVNLLAFKKVCTTTTTTTTTTNNNNNNKANC